MTLGVRGERGDDEHAQTLRGVQGDEEVQRSAEKTLPHEREATRRAGGEQDNEVRRRHVRRKCTLAMRGAVVSRVQRAAEVTLAMSLRRRGCVTWSACGGSQHLR